MWRQDGWKCQYLGKKANRYFELGADAMLKAIYEWGNEHDPCATNVVRSKRECFTCWLELLKGIG